MGVVVRGGDIHALGRLRACYPVANSLARRERAPRGGFAMKIARKNLKADIPATAMGDIAFNLLIFFVILAKSQDDSHLSWTPAKAKNLQASGHSMVSVLIDQKNKLYLNGQELGIRELSGRIEQQLGNQPAGERTVLLKVHQEALAQRFEPVIEAISQAGGELVHIVEENKEK